MDLSPDNPLRETIARTPGRMPLELKVADAEGRVLIRLNDLPDPGLRREAKFTGTALWKTDPLKEALRAEQYYPLWRGGTGGYRPLAGIGSGAYRKLLKNDSDDLEARLGLARSLMVDAQLRGPAQEMRQTNPLPHSTHFLNSLFRILHSRSPGRGGIGIGRRLIISTARSN